MKDLVIVDHHRDVADEVYRLTVGYVVEEDGPVLDENGEPVMEEDRLVATEVPAVDENGDPVFDEDGPKMEPGEPLLVPGGPRIERQRFLVPMEDFVFAAFDDRWEGKTPEEIVREQKRLVRAALRKRDEPVAAREIEQLPGVGDSL